MTINSPAPAQVPALRRLWKQAFGDTDAFLDSFFSLGFSPDRCRCLTADGQLAAALYWFDAEYDGQKLAYLYAVATDEAFQNQGLCRKLMEDTHAHLRSKGYDGAMLVPENKSLFRLYEKLGYRTATHIREFSCTASGRKASLRPVAAKEYAALRRQLLPPGGVVQEGPALALLDTQASFYAGENFLLAAAPESDDLFVPELLGPPEAAPDILTSLGRSRGRFRAPGKEIPFAMYLPLSLNATTPPAYFGLALD